MAKYKKRKDGRYAYQFIAGYDSLGKKKIKTVYGRTIPELEAKIFEAKSNPALFRQKITVSQYCRQYVATFKHNKSDNTRAMYEHSIDYHIEKDFDGMYMCDLTAADVQKAVNGLSDKRRTAEIMLVLLKQACAQAIDDGILQRNPCRKIELPPKKKAVEKRALTEAEKNIIKTVDFTTKEAAFVFLLYGCGMRREEILGLRLCDVSRGLTAITIKQVVTFPDNAAVIKEYPKNDTSLRTVPVPTSCAERIKPYFEEMDAISDKNGLLFPGISKTVYLRFWRRIQAKIGSEDITAHTFRHNYATMLYYSGISIKQAAALMGHANTKMIMEVYAHIDAEKENVSERLNSII